MLKNGLTCPLLVAVVISLCQPAFAESKGTEPYWYKPMMAVNSGFDGNPGYVAQFGDSITNSMAFWAAMGWTYPDKFIPGEGAVGDDGFPKKPSGKRWRDIIKGANRKGPDQGNQSGWTIDELLPAVEPVLKREKPEVAIIMVGTNDIRMYGDDRQPDQAMLDRYRSKLEKIVEECLDANCIPVLNTIPPRRGCAPAVDAVNEIIRKLAAREEVPLVDYHAAIVKAQPDGAWDGTLIGKDGVHPGNTGGKHTDFSKENTKVNGYALRSWLNFLMFRELYFRILSAPKPFIEKINKVEADLRPGIKCPVTADTEVGAYADGRYKERIWNWGKASRVKIKGVEEFLLYKFDTSKVPDDFMITKATLYIPRSGQCVIPVVGVSSISADWKEGDGDAWRSQTMPKDVKDQGAQSHGGVTFDFAEYPDKPWTPAGGDFKCATFGEGGSLYGYAKTGYAMGSKSSPKYSTVELPLDVAQSMLIKDDSYGIAVSEEKGQRAFVKGFHKVPNPNHFVYTKESGNGAFLILEGKKISPAEVDVISSPETEYGVEAGEIVLSWRTPKQKLLGYDVYVSKQAIEPGALKESDKLPRTLTYRPVGPGETQKFWIDNLEVGVEYNFAVVGYDKFGTKSKATVFSGVTRPEGVVVLEKPAEALEVSKGSPAKNGDFKVWACLSNQQVNPLTGDLLHGGDKSSYKNGNLVWNGADKKIELYGGTNDFSGFQLLVENTGSTPVEVSLKISDLEHDQGWWAKALGALTFSSSSKPVPAKNCDIFTVWCSKFGNDWYPDALVPFPGSIPVPDPVNKIDGQKVQAFYFDLYVPGEHEPGQYGGEITVSAKDAEIVIPVELTVWNFQLPDKLSFIPEMNAYAAPRNDPAKNVENIHNVHRLAHENRTNINILPYSHHGNFTVPEFNKLKVEGEGADMKISNLEEFDRTWGPLLTGEAFKDNPRSGVPVSGFYLPFYEQWPCDLGKGYKLNQQAKTLDIKDDFTDEYKAGWQSVLNQFADHIKKKGYDKTNFHLYLNNKYINSDNLYWCLDEPVFRDSIVCLGMFGDMTREASEKAYPDAMIDYRVDLSRVEEAKDELNKTDLMVMAQKNHDKYPELIREHARKYAPRKNQPDGKQEIWNYGSTVTPGAPTDVNRAFTVKTYLKGADGVLPWQTVGQSSSWDKVEKSDLSVFYPAFKKWGYNGCYGSLRLKSFRDGQQDAEYLNMLSIASGGTRKEVEKALTPYISFESVVKKMNELDAGSVSFSNADAEKLETMRRVLGYNINLLHE